MNTPFQYTTVSTDFITKLCDLALRGESTVLLGARYGAKRYVMKRVRRYLSETNAGPVVSVKFLNEPLVSTQSLARELIKKAVLKSQQGLQINDGADDFLHAIDDLYRQTGKTVFLVGSNVDGMAHHLARHFLQGVRKRVEERQLVAILSGEDDFRDLVYGPNSEFNCANNFVLQGFAKDEFNNYIDRYLELLREDFKLSPENRDELWSRTGGNGYLMRMVLRKLVEDCVRASNQERMFDFPDIPASLGRVGIPDAFGAPYFSRVTDLIAGDPRCWNELERLMNGSNVRVGWEDNPPSRLELAGVAKRDSNRLLFQSPLMENFIKQHYDDRRFGDLYISAGDWERGFERYSRLSLEETMRPSGADDKPEVEWMINALCAALHLRAARGPESVQNLFVKGCRYLLGFRDITFWKKGTAWKPSQLKDFTPKREALEELASLLPHNRSAKPDLFQVTGPWEKCSIAAILPTLGQDEQSAVVIGDFERRTVISPERARLAKKVLGHFISAFGHAVNVEKTEQRLKVRNSHIEIINSIFEALGSEVRDARQVIVMAASKLRRLGYRRVLFSLVDPQQKEIQGVWDDSDDKSVDIAADTNWPLDPPTADLQPYVIFTKEPKIVPDASKEPLANPSVVDKAKMKSEAIVPILNPDEEAIGTIHIERTDGSVPSQEEVDDLLLFGRQLAVVIEQSDRVNMLQSGLDKIPEPVLIVDSLKKTRYANKMANGLIGVPVGWKTRREAQPLSGEGLDQIVGYIGKTLGDEHRRVHHLKGIGNDPSYRGAVLFDKIQDCRPQTVGVLTHIEDINYFHKVFEALRFIAEANDVDSALQSVLESMEKLGHKWGRLYVVDPQNPDRLISKLCYGCDLDPLTFSRGDIELTLRTDPTTTLNWKCIEDKDPVVFCWNESREDEESWLTENGLRVINVKTPFWPAAVPKEQGETWIDFPLITEEKTLGKMCLQCDPDFHPEDFEMLKVLSRGLLDAFVRREREFERQKELAQQNADNTLDLTGHTINGHIANLSALLRRFRKYQGSAVGLKELNDRFEGALDRIASAIGRMRERLGPLHPKPERFELMDLIHQSLSSSLPDENWELSSGQTSVEVFWDRHLVDAVLTELIQNSIAFAKDPGNFQVRIAVECNQLETLESIRLFYRDNGPGVPDQLKLKIFSEFFSERPGPHVSTGIGLTFVQRVAQKHGGSVREVGKFGEGAEFKFLIPRDPFGLNRKEEWNVSFPNN